MTIDKVTQFYSLQKLLANTSRTSHFAALNSFSQNKYKHFKPQT